MKKTFLLPILLALGAYLVPLPGLSAPPLSERIEEKREQIEQKKRAGGRALDHHPALHTRIDAVEGELEATQRQLDRAQASLDAQKAELLEVRDRLEEARDRLETLRSELATAAREVLAARLVEIYKADAPDVLTVVLESDGFGDLLERAEFLDRISDQDREITDRGARAARPRARPDGPARRARGARAARRRAHPARRATRSPRSRSSSWLA